MNRGKLVTLAALALLLAALPAAGGALSSKVAVPAIAVGDTMDAFSGYRSCLGVEASSEWLRQAYIGGTSINLRLYDACGDRRMFEEDLQRLSMETKEMRLSLRLRDAEGFATLEIDQKAIDLLSHYQIVEIAVADAQSTVLAVYGVKDVQAVRDALGLTAAERICLSGDEYPVTVVSEDGIRRLID